MLSVRSHRAVQQIVKMSNKMFDIIFNLKFQAKELNRNAKKSEKSEKVEKDKAFKAMQKNNMEGARIHAANAIRCHNENLQFLRIASQCVPCALIRDLLWRNHARTSMIITADDHGSRSHAEQPLCG